MQLIQDLDQYHSNESLALTIGSFDGVHAGHRSIIQHLHDSAGDLPMAVLTFDVHPRVALNKDPESLLLLNSTQEKLDLLESCGVDRVFLLPADERIFSLTAEEFVQTILVEKLHVQHIAIGYDHRFGKNRAGDIHLLRLMGEKLGFTVQEIPAHVQQDLAVSSTKIRSFLKEGDLETANCLLGAEYRISGIVVQGDQLGRTIGFPTANIQIEEPRKLIPPTGIFAVNVWVDGKHHEAGGMFYIGYRPALDKNELRCEVNLFDFEGDLYGKRISLGLVKRTRGDQKVDGLEALIDLLKSDERTIREILSKQSESISN